MALVASVMWNLPRTWFRPVSPALADGFLTTGPPEKSLNLSLTTRLLPPVNSAWRLVSVLNPAPLATRSLKDGRVEGRLLIFSCKNSQTTTHCWTTMDRRMLDSGTKGIGEMCVLKSGGIQRDRSLRGKRHGKETFLRNLEKGCLISQGCLWLISHNYLMSIDPCWWKKEREEKIQVH